MMRTIKDCIDVLKLARMNMPDSSDAFNYAIDFIRFHNKSNVIFYKDYFAPIYFSSKMSKLYGKAISKDSTKPAIFVEGESIDELVNDLHYSVDLLENIQL